MGWVEGVLMQKITKATAARTDQMVTAAMRSDPSKPWWSITMLLRVLNSGTATKKITIAKNGNYFVPSEVLHSISRLRHRGVVTRWRGFHGHYQLAEEGR
jgi:hypothetical protein